LGTLLLDPQDITIVAGGGSSFNTINGRYSFDGQVLFEEAGPSVLSQAQLETLPGNANILIQAIDSITIEPMDRGVLAFQPGAGDISFEAGGQFSMSPNNTINTGSRNLTIIAGDVAVGRIDSSTASLAFSNLLGPGGDVNLAAIDGNINAGTILTGGGRAGDVVALAENGSFVANQIDLQALSFSPGAQPGALVVSASEGVSVGRIFPSGRTPILVNDTDLSGSSRLFVPGAAVGETPPVLTLPITPIISTLPTQGNSGVEATQTVQTGIQIADENQLIAGIGSVDSQINQMLNLATFGTSLADSAQLVDLAFGISQGINGTIKAATGITGPTVNLETNLLLADINSKMGTVGSLYKDTLRDIANGASSSPSPVSSSDFLRNTIYDGQPGTPGFFSKVINDNFAQGYGLGP